jgi:hypothetical protein
MISFGRLDAVGKRLTGRFRSGQDTYSTVLPRSSRTAYVLPFSKQTPPAGGTSKREASGNTENSAVSSRRIAEASIAN